MRNTHQCKSIIGGKRFLLTISYGTREEARHYFPHITVIPFIFGVSWYKFFAHLTLWIFPKR